MNQIIIILRKYYFGSDKMVIFGLMCSGCKYKYQIYFNAKFPFIHQNLFKLNVDKILSF